MPSRIAGLRKTVAISALRGIGIAGGTILQLGLAILGRGGFADYFSSPPLIALSVATVAISVALFAGENLSAGVREDRANRWVMPVLSVIGLVSLFVPAWTDRKDILSIDHNAIRWVGVVLFAAGGALRIWPVFVLGYRFSGIVAIPPGYELVTTGLYRVIRHPSYLGLLVNAIGWSLAFRSGVGLLLTALLLVPVLARVNAEEHVLHDRFGAEYDTWRARTWRLDPGVY